MKRLAVLVPLLLAVLPGCASGVPADPSPFAEQRMRDWVELHERKAEVADLAFDPRVFEVPGHGVVQVREWHLEGGPGWEYIRARFTYQNTTGKPIDEARITLIVENGDGSRATAGRLRLTHPLGRKLAPGMMFVDEIKTDTLGVHNDSAGWRWTVDVEAVENPDWGIAFADDPAK